MIPLHALSHLFVEMDVLNSFVTISVNVSSSFKLVSLQPGVTQLRFPFCPVNPPKYTATRLHVCSLTVPAIYEITIQVYIYDGLPITRYKQAL